MALCSVRLYRIRVLSEVDSNVVFILVAVCRTVFNPLNFVSHITEWYSWLSEWSWNINGKLILKSAVRKFLCDDKDEWIDWKDCDELRAQRLNSWCVLLTLRGHKLLLVHQRMTYNLLCVRGSTVKINKSQHINSTMAFT